MRRSEFAGIPACSSASHATSSSRRCCGSILAASRGEISKNSASKASMLAQERAPSGGTRPAPPPPRASRRRMAAIDRRHLTDRGPAVTQELPQRFWARVSPPGKRQPRPMTAIGSSRDASTRSVAPRLARIPARAQRESAASALIVGCCQNSTGETGRPSSSDNSPESTTASRDPTPRSFSDRSGSIFFGIAADGRYQVIHQPVSKFGLAVDIRCHTGTSKRVKSSSR